jgi:hypothetical protein
MYVRLDAVRTGVELLDEGLSIVITFIQPAGARIVIARRDQRIEASLWVRTDGQPWARRDTDSARLSVAAGTVIELSLDLATIGLASAAPVSFFVTLYDASGSETERHPPYRPIETTVPDASFASRNWTA